MTEEKGTVSYEVEGPIATITLSRPGKRNSMTQKMFRELGVIVEKAAGEAGLRVLIVRGDQETFCAGDDLGELVSMDLPRVRDFLAGVGATFTRIESLPFPVIAAVEGYALGGGLELALACDLILLSEEALLGLPELNLGVIPGLGGTIRLPRRVGLGRARELIYSGRLVRAEEARSIGLAEEVYPSESFGKKIREYGESLAVKSPWSLALAKSTINRGMDASLEAGLALERETFACCFALPDAKEGIAAFLEKRKPEFK